MGTFEAVCVIGRMPTVACMECGSSGPLSRAKQPLDKAPAVAATVR